MRRSRAGYAGKVEQVNKSVFAARQQYIAGRITKWQFNRIVGESVMAKWVPVSVQTEPCWRWLCELSAYLELKQMGYE
jgi:hypothetical protein